jgi:hypothetical protein
MFSVRRLRDSSGLLTDIRTPIDRLITVATIISSLIDPKLAPHWETFTGWETFSSILSDSSRYLFCYSDLESILTKTCVHQYAIALSLPKSLGGI